MDPGLRGYLGSLEALIEEWSSMKRHEYDVQPKRWDGDSRHRPRAEARDEPRSQRMNLLGRGDLREDERSNAMGWYDECFALAGISPLALARIWRGREWSHKSGWINHVSVNGAGDFVSEPYWISTQDVRALCDLASYGFDVVMFGSSHGDGTIGIKVRPGTLELINSLRRASEPRSQRERSGKTRVMTWKRV